MNKILSLFQKAFKFFASDKGQAALKQALELVPKAAPIVSRIDEIAGSDRTVHAVATAFAFYGVPFAEDYLALGPGPALLHLATEVLAQQAPGVATNILNSAVQIAVTGGKK